MTTQRPFRFGVVTGQSQTGAAWLSTARTVEALGYQTLLLPDTARTPSPFPALAAAAAVTSTLTVGTWVLAAPLRTPAAVARDTATLQLLSAGRFELGMGTGRPDAALEAQHLGQQWGTARDRLRRLLETVTAVREHVLPMPRIVVAAAGPRALTAGHDADTVALALPPIASVHDVGRVADLARTGGRDPELALQMSGVAGHLVTYLTRQGLTPDDLTAAAGVLDGDTDAMAHTLVELRSHTGVSYITIAAEHAELFAPVAHALTTTQT